MFIYGQDIPLDDVVIEEAAELTRQPVESVEFLFDYGKEIFQETSTD